MSQLYRDVDYPPSGDLSTLNSRQRSPTTAAQLARPPVTSTTATCRVPETSIWGSIAMPTQPLMTSFSQYSVTKSQGLGSVPDLSYKEQSRSTSPSRRSSWSSGSSSRPAPLTWTSTSGEPSSPGPQRLRKTAGKPTPGSPRSLLDTPPHSPANASARSGSLSAIDTAHMKRRLGTGSESWGHSGSTAARSESAETVYPLTPSKLQKFGVHSPKELTAGTIATYILLLKSNLGLENVLVALGMLIRDPITANKVHRMGASAALIEIFDTTPSEDNAALAVWCLTRVCRSDDIANGLLKLNLAKLLVTKGFKSGSRIACVAGWCLGALIRSDTLADTLTDMGFVPALCENVRRCADSSSPEEQSAAIYTVARIARSIKAAEALARSGCAAVLAQYLLTTESPMVLLWSARAVGCLLGPDSTDMATVLLEAGVGRGLGRLPSTLSAGEVDALEGFAFAIQRFCSAEWGGEARKALVDAGIVKSLLDAQRSAANEPRPEIHIEIAHALARVADVGGASIRKQIVNGGAIEILKRVGNPAARPDVAKACNLAAKSITGNLWSRNQASSKVALSHDWSVGCPEHLPDCLSPVIDVSRDR